MPLLCWPSATTATLSLALPTSRLLASHITHIASIFHLPSSDILPFSWLSFSLCALVGCRIAPNLASSVVEGMVNSQAHSLFRAQKASHLSEPGATGLSAAAALRSTACCCSLLWLAAAATLLRGSAALSPGPAVWRIKLAVTTWTLDSG